MDVVQRSAPGFIDQHLVLLALTPMLLAGLTTLAVRMFPSTGRAGRVIAIIGLGGAITIQGLFLRPFGAAIQVDASIGWGHLVRVALGPDIVATILPVWAMWYWFRAQEGGVLPTWRWSGRAAGALALPILCLPLTLLWLEAEVAPRGRALRMSAVILGCLGLLVLPPQMVMVPALIAYSLPRSPWRWPLTVAGVVALLPPWSSVGHL